MQSPITRIKDLSKNQKEVFDAVFNPSSHMLLLEKQLVLAACTTTDTRIKVAKFYAQGYIAKIKPLVQQKPTAKKSSPKADMATVMRAKENAKTEGDCLALIFQDLYLPPHEADDRFWNFLTTYLIGTLLANTEVTSLKKAFSYLMQAYAHNRLTDKDVKEYGVKVRETSHAKELMNLYRKATTELEALELTPGALDLTLLNSWVSEFLMQYMKISTIITLFSLTVTFALFVKHATSIPAIIIALILAHHHNATLQSSIMVFILMLVIHELAIKSFNLKKIFAEKQIIVDKSLDELTQLFGFVPVKFIKDGITFRTQMARMYIKEEQIQETNLSAAVIFSKAEVSTEEAPPEKVSEEVTPEKTATETEKTLPTTEKADTGNVHVPKPARRGLTIAPLPESTSTPIATRIITIDPIKKFYARLDEEALHSQRIPEITIEIFRNALKENAGLLPPKSKGKTGVKLLNTPVIIKGNIMTAKLKIIAKGVDSGARVFSRAIREDDKTIHVFSEYVPGSKAHR